MENSRSRPVRRPSPNEYRPPRNQTHHTRPSRFQNGWPPRYQAAAAPQYQAASAPQYQAASAPQYQAASAAQYQAASAPQYQGASAPPYQAAWAPGCQAGWAPQGQPGWTPQYQTAWTPQLQPPLQPQYQPNIDLRHRPNIDPRYQPAIDPRYQYNINPRYQHNIDPRYQHNIDPRYQHNIGPRYQHNIDPRYQPNIDPRAQRLQTENDPWPRLPSVNHPRPAQFQATTTQWPRQSASGPTAPLTQPNGPRLQSSYAGRTAWYQPPDNFPRAGIQSTDAPLPTTKPDIRWVPEDANRHYHMILQPGQSVPPTPNKEHLKDALDYCQSTVGGAQPQERIQNPYYQMSAKQLGSNPAAIPSVYQPQSQLQTPEGRTDFAKTESSQYGQPQASQGASPQQQESAMNYQQGVISSEQYTPQSMVVGESREFIQLEMVPEDQLQYVQHVMGESPQYVQIDMVPGEYVQPALMSSDSQYIQVVPTEYIQPALIPGEYIQSPLVPGDTPHYIQIELVPGESISHDMQAETNKYYQLEVVQGPPVHYCQLDLVPEPSTSYMQTEMAPVSAYQPVIPQYHILGQPLHVEPTQVDTTGSQDAPVHADHLEHSATLVTSVILKPIFPETTSHSVLSAQRTVVVTNIYDTTLPTTTTQPDLSILATDLQLWYTPATTTQQQVDAARNPGVIARPPRQIPTETTNLIDFLDSLPYYGSMAVMDPKYPFDDILERSFMTDNEPSHPIPALIWPRRIPDLPTPSPDVTRAETRPKDLSVPVKMEASEASLEPIKTSPKPLSLHKSSPQPKSGADTSDKNRCSLPAGIEASRPTESQPSLPMAELATDPSKSKLEQKSLRSQPASCPSKVTGQFHLAPGPSKSAPNLSQAVAGPSEPSPGPSRRPPIRSRSRKFMALPSRFASRSATYIPSPYRPTSSGYYDASTTSRSTNPHTRPAKCMHRPAWVSYYDWTPETQYACLCFRGSFTVLPGVRNLTLPPHVKVSQADPYAPIIVSPAGPLPETPKDGWAEPGESDPEDGSEDTVEEDPNPEEDN